MSLAILFNGPPGSGKDAIGRAVADYLGFYTMAFKDGIYPEAAKLTKLSTQALKELHEQSTQERKQVTRQDLNGWNLRELLIHTSEDLIKPKLGVDYYGRSLVERAIENQYTDIVVTDSGFAQELRPVAEYFEHVLVVRLYRDDCTFAGDSRNYLVFTQCRHNVKMVDYHNASTIQDAVNYVMRTIISEFLTEP